MKTALARVSALAIAPTLIVLGCRESAAGDDDPISPDVYVGVMAELADLRRFPPAGGDLADRDARADSMRKAILEAHAVTAAELLAFAEQAGPDPGRMESLAERIAAMTDSLGALRDTAVAPEPVADDAAGIGDGREESPDAEPLRPELPAGGNAVPPGLRDRLDSLRAARRRPSG